MLVTPPACQSAKSNTGLEKALLPFVEEGVPVVIAYSGGLDSHVLLHLCARLSPHTTRAIHIHHGLNREADLWAAHCEKICHQLAIPLTLIRVDAKPGKGESREEAARNARYAALKSQLCEGEHLFTAQHQEDQAETLLLQLFRGCGLKGLAAMPLSTPFAQGQLVRPLLNCSQQALQDYALENELQWIEDVSNSDQSYDRNYLRHAIMPLLERRWPTISGRLARTSSHCGEASSLLGGMADRLLCDLLSDDGESLLVDRVIELSGAQKRLILRRWIESYGARPPSEKLLQQIVETVLTAAVDAMPSVNWSNYCVRRYRNRLFFLKERGDFFVEADLEWDAREPKIAIEGSGELIAGLTPEVGISAKLWDQGAVRIRFRQGGERLRPVGRTGTHQLKKLFQEAGIPPWERKKTPLVYIDDKLAAVSGLWIADWCKGEGEGKDVSLTFVKA